MSRHIQNTSDGGHLAYFIGFSLVTSMISGVCVGTAALIGIWD